MSDEYDGLHLCENCGDVYCLDVTCPDCQRQEQIDRGVGLPDTLISEWPEEMDEDWPEEEDDCDRLGHDWTDGYCAYCGAPEPDRTRG